jgi:hypothetical protein
MGFNSSPESDDPSKKSAPTTLDFSGFQSPFTIPDRKEDELRQTLPSAQSASRAEGFPLPSLDLQHSDSRLSLPPELILLYRETGLLGKPPEKERPATSRPEAPAATMPGEQGRPGADQPRPPAAEQAQNPNNQMKTDASGYVTDIVYPGGKTRHIERDPATHEAKSITTNTAEGTTKLLSQNGRWYMEVQGLQLPFPGKVEAAKNGDVAMQTSNDGVWRIEKPDGKVSEEKENADGARISFDDNHKLSKITRKDGTTFEQTNGNTIVESHPGAKPITWTNQGGVWSADNGEKPRKNFALREDGSVSFEDASGIKHSINGRGAETLEGAGLGKITPDASNRPREVETADGKKVRKYDYFDDNSTDIKSVTIVDKTQNSSMTYTRESKDSKQWRNEQGQVWSGEIRVSPDGVHSIKASNQYRNYDDDDSPKDNTRWTSYYPDGRETSDQINSDNSRASYDKQNNLVSFRGPDGVRIDRLSINGQETITHYDPKIGETVNWTKNGDGKWVSDSPRFKDARKDLGFNTNGELNYTNDNGGKVQGHRDGTKQIVEKDGTKLDFDKDGQITKATRGNLERTFVRDGSGIAVVKDKNLSTKEERTVFERRPPGEENRKNIFVSPNGDLSYQNSDGTAVIERSNMLHLDLDKDGDITRVVGPKGTRSFQYIGEGEHKALVNVTDTRKTEKGDKTETWTRVANPDGSLSSEFRSKDDAGKDRKSRYNITPCADGEYEYRLAADKAGDKAHVEKLTKEGVDGMPEGIEDARQELVSHLEGVMEKSRLDQNIEFMKKFEKRMMDQAELQIAAGIDSDKVMKETEKCIIDTYYNCARLTAPQGSKQLYGQKDRVRLAENLLYLAQDPSDIKQGGQGTCWWESSWNVGLFQRNAGDAARLCADVALTGQYTSTAGPLRGGGPKTIRIPPEHVRLDRRDSGAGWTPQNAKSSSQRSMVGMLIDQIGPPLGGQRGWGQSDGGWHSEARNILYMMTGRDNIRHGSSSLGRHEKLELLKTGGWTSSGGGHMWAYTMHKEKDGSWVVIRDDQYNNADRVIQRVNNLKSWISQSDQSEVRKNWRGHQNKRSDDSPSPKPDSRPAPRPTPRPRPTDDEEYDNGRVNVVQMVRPVWTNQRRSW